MKQVLKILWCLSLLLLGWDAAAASSSGATIIGPDFVCNTPTCGALYVQQASLGVEVSSPTGVTLIWTTNDIVGGGQVHVRQAGIDNSYGGAGTALPILALQLPYQISYLSNGSTQLPSPDVGFPFGSNGGGGSYIRTQSLSGDIDWTAGIATPVGDAYGVFLTVMNTGGSTINVIDAQWSGTMRVGYPSIAWGQYETLTFMHDSFGWFVFQRGPGVFPTMGNDGGGRVITTTNATPALLMEWTTNGNGGAFVCDVAADLTTPAVPGTALWQGVRCAWNSVGTITRPLSIDEQSGDNSGSVPTGWALSCTNVLSPYVGLYVTGVASTSIHWRANNCHGVTPP